MSRNGLRRRVLGSQSFALIVTLLIASPSSFAFAGSLVIAGGGLSPDDPDVFQAILERGLPGRPICVLATAHAEPERVLPLYVEDFERHADHRRPKPVAVPIALTLDKPDASDPEVLSSLESCGGVFFTGGDQMRITRVLAPGGERSEAASRLHQLLAEGGVIAGTSAGAAMMSDPMIAGGRSDEALADGVTRDLDGQGVVLAPGMGFWPGVQVDQHALERGRLGRLLVATGETSERLGFAIDRATALVVDDFPRTPRATVVGASHVVVVELLEGGPPASRIHLLAAGDGYDVGARRVLPADDRAELEQDGGPVEDLHQPWQDDVFHRQLLTFAVSAQQTWRLGEGDLAIELRKVDGYRVLGPQASLFAGPIEIR